MFRPLALIAIVFLAAPGAADDKDWTGKTIKLTETVKLGSKLGGGFVRDGAQVKAGETFVVKSDDGRHLELVGQTGFVLKSEAEVVASRAMPRRNDPAGKGDRNLWAFGTKVLPKKPTGQIPFGDRDEDGKQTSFKLSGLMPMEVRKDNGDGWVRIHDGRREGWVSKGDLVTKEDAPAYWDKAVKANPKDTWALHMRGIGWREKGEPDKALKDLNECIRLDPSDARVYNSRGDAWCDKNDYDKAIADFTEAIRLDPKHVQAYNNRGYAWLNKNDHDKAIADYTEAIRLDPKGAPAYNSRGLGWFNKKDYDKAIADCTEAIRLDPKDALVYYSRGLGWFNKKDYDKAIADYTEAIRLDPKYAPAYNNRGLAWINKKEYDKAIADYTEAIRLDPKGVRAYYNRGYAWFNKKEYDKAIADCTEAIRLDPKDALAYNNRGNVWFNKKDYDKAIADYTEAIRLDPKDALAYSNRGNVWSDKKDYDKASGDFDKALELDPRYAYAVGNRAIMLTKLKKYDAATEGFEAAIKLNPMDWLHREYAFFLASCPDAKYRDGKKAVEFAKKGIEKAGRDADWQYFAVLAAAYAEAGDFKHAISEQRKVLEDRLLDKDDKKMMEERLGLYRTDKAFRAD